jgi:hypothetical protein
MKKITVTIKGGEAQVATEGFTGGECLKETAGLKKALGDVTEEKLTAEGCRVGDAERERQQQ